MASSAACLRLPCAPAGLYGPQSRQGAHSPPQQTGPAGSIVRARAGLQRVGANGTRNGGVVASQGSFWGGVLQWDSTNRNYQRVERRAGACRCAGNEDGGKPGRSYSLYDQASNLLTNVLNPGGSGNMPVAEGAVSDLFGRPLFFALYDWFMEHGPIYKLAFGPKAFVVISDPIIARYILRENTFGYDKGVLADILEPIMGKGLIPADLETWKGRRRAVVPAFHAAYLEAMVGVFGRCGQRTVDKLDALLAGAGGEVRIDMEAEYSNLALDIIGISVFNYDFGSVTKESPIIQAVYGVLYEAEHRSTFYVPYWKFPPARWLVPRQRKFATDMALINATLTDLINQARDTRQEEDLEALQQRDYSKVKDASLLRFLVDMRGEDATNQQLRDDLMTMLIAGHETTAAVLTWATFMLAQSPAAVAKAQEEVDRVLADRQPTLADIKQLEFIRLIVAESLRLYPQPPLLIRRSLQPDTLPGGHNGHPEGHAIPAGTDLFISVYNVHRSPHCWNDPEAFRPERFQEARPGFEGWAGFDPSRSPGALYPNETMADFAYLPFGGGSRKCVGDQFAVMESVVGLAMLLRRYNIALAGTPEDVQMQTGATIHTKDGLWCRLTKRQPGTAARAQKQAAVTV